MKIEAQIVADSINPFGDRITSMVVTMPRFILAEFNTHRVFSRNSASSRAIPFNRMVEMIQSNPFIPTAWQKDHRGMQGLTYILDKVSIQRRVDQWLYAKDLALLAATKLYEPLTEYEKIQDEQAFWEDEESVTKQLCNRLLEPFMYHRVLVTSTHWDNFWDLRCPQYEFNSWSTNNVYHYKSRKELLKAHPENNIPNDWTDLDWLKINKGQAEIHMMALAEAMYDAYHESKPIKLKEGEWHIPWSNTLDIRKLYEVNEGDNPIEDILKISTGMSARTSYTTVGDEKEVKYETLISIHDKMLVSKPFHASPFEHAAQCMGERDLENYIRVEDGKTEVGWCRNFKGWIQYRAIIEGRDK